MNKHIFQDRVSVGDDLSALVAFMISLSILLICIIGPKKLSPYPDLIVKLQYPAIYIVKYKDLFK